ncbi:MAG: hypothetical protein SGJ07_04050 [Rhodospirillaceae bacterium]|nr:hypothetical protein [Rhodospirillaceae bacterium]
MKTDLVTLDPRYQAALAIPGWTVGAWRRELLEWDDGEDRETEVLWLQTPILFADIRNPVDDSKIAEGFAGHLSVTRQTCRWNRPIDVKPKGGDGDIGVVSTRGTRMIELGVHRNYLEEWRRIDDGKTHFAASRGAMQIGDDGVRWPASGPLEIVVGIGPHLIHAWRSDNGVGVAYGRPGADGSWSPERRAGILEHKPAQGTWTIWSAAPDTQAAAGILARI